MTSLPASPRHRRASEFPSSAAHKEEQESCLALFEGWSEGEQVEFVTQALARMCHHQHGLVDTFLKPMLQRDFISALPGPSSAGITLFVYQFTLTLTFVFKDIITMSEIL